MEGEPPIEGQPVSSEGRRVYPPSEVQARLEVSASGLRRLALIYERTIGPLPRDDRGRVWPEDAVEALEDARALVRESRAVSIEAALRGQEVGFDAEPHPVTKRPHTDEINPGAAILEELRALRAAIEHLTRREEEQSRRIAELEEAVRGGRELETSEEPANTTEAANTTEVLTPIRVSPETKVSIPSDPRVTERVTRELAPHAQEDPEFGGDVAGEERTEARTGLWRRVASWFGFGRPRS